MVTSSQSQGELVVDQKLNNCRHIMLFDLDTTGHHPTYIQHFVKYYCNQEISGKLDIVVSPKFIEEHSDIVNMIQKSHRQNVNFIPITLEEYSSFINKSSLLKRIFCEWNIYCKYAKNLNADHCLLMYLDKFQLPIALRGKSPCSFSGIYFRPTFHYQDFEGYVPSWKESLRQWRQKLLLSRVLQNSQFKILFCLDPFVIKYIQKLNSKVKTIHLPDPVEIYDTDKYQVEQLKRILEIQENRQVFLLFGSLARRKGIYQLLEAIKLLPSEVCEQLCLLLVGSIIPSEKLPLESLIKEISQSLPVQIIIRDEFVPEPEVHLYFQMTDVVLATYQRHVGMSGILLLAAAAQKPVLASDYGLLGYLVRHHQLGITVDSTFPGEISQGIAQLIYRNGQDCCDLGNIDNFSRQHCAVKFSSTLITHLL